MAKIVIEDHPPAYAYDDRTIKAVKVLLEIGQILGSYHSKFVVVGGAVPWLLLDNPQMRHIGSLDVDLSLDPVALGDGEYAQLVDELRKHGYAHNEDPKKKFQMLRTIEANDGGPPILIVVDFLMPRDAKYEKNVPPLVEGFAVQRADGARLALAFSQDLPIEGEMPKGGKNRIEMKVASIPALLAMKGFALKGRMKDKDPYDIYYCVRNYPDGVDALVADCKPLLEDPEALSAYQIIAEKFLDRDYHGPISVARFAAEGNILEDRDADQWQTDAYGQVNAWLKGLGLA